MKKFYILLFILLAGCSQPKINKKYAVVSAFNDVVLETDDKTKAYEAAHGLTLMGRVLASKPCYFVIENIAKED